MSNYINQQSFAQTLNKNTFQESRVVQNVTYSTKNYSTFDYNGLVKKLKELNAEESRIKSSNYQSVDLNGRLQSLHLERQGLLKLINQKGYSQTEIVTTQVHPSTLIGHKEYIMTKDQTSIPKISNCPPIRKSIRWINANDFNSNSNLNYATHTSVTEIKETVNPSFVSQTINYVTPVTQTQTVSYNGRDYYGVMDSYKNQVNTTTVEYQTKDESSHQVVNVEKSSEHLNHVIADPEFSLNNYETFIDDYGNKHIRYVVKVGIYHNDHPETEKHIETKVKETQHTEEVKEQEFQHKPIEHTTFDKNGNPVKVYTTIDDKGLPLQIINITQDNTEIQYVSFLNDEGRQQVKLLSQFLKEHSSEFVKQTETTENKVEVEEKHEEEKHEVVHEHTETFTHVQVEQTEESVNHLEAEKMNREEEYQITTEDNKGELAVQHCEMHKVYQTEWIPVECEDVKNEHSQNNQVTELKEEENMDTKVESNRHIEELNRTLPTKQKLVDLLRSSFKHSDETEEVNIENLPSEIEILSIIRNKTTEAILKEHKKVKDKKDNKEVKSLTEKEELIKKLNKTVNKVQKYLDVLEEIDPNLKKTIEFKHEQLRRQTLVYQNQTETQATTTNHNLESNNYVRNAEQQYVDRNVDRNEIIYRSEYRTVQPLSSRTVTRVSQHEVQRKIESNYNDFRSEFRNAAELLNHSKPFTNEIQSSIGVGGIRVTRKSTHMNSNQVIENRSEQRTSEYQYINTNSPNKIYTGERRVVSPRRINRISENNYANFEKERDTTFSSRNYQEPMVYNSEGKLVPLGSVNLTSRD